MNVFELRVQLSIANPESLVWGVERISIIDKIVYLIDKEGNILVKGDHK